MGADPGCAPITVRGQAAPHHTCGLHACAAHVSTTFAPRLYRTVLGGRGHTKTGTVPPRPCSALQHTRFTVEGTVTDDAQCPYPADAMPMIRMYCPYTQNGKMRCVTRSPRCHAAPPPHTHTHYTHGRLVIATIAPSLKPPEAATSAAPVLHLACRKPQDGRTLRRTSDLWCRAEHIPQPPSPKRRGKSKQSAAASSDCLVYAARTSVDAKRCEAT